MGFRVHGQIVFAETIAIGRSIRDLPRLLKRYGRARWRKRKGLARVELPNSRKFLAEVHWYEAHGYGRVELKIKRLLKEC